MHLVDNIGMVRAQNATSFSSAQLCRASNASRLLKSITTVSFRAGIMEDTTGSQDAVVES